MAHLSSGRYTIANAKFENVATLLNGDQAADIVSGVQNDIPSAQWDITRLSNDNYMIKNHQYGSFVNRGPNPKQGESVFGGDHPRQWKITEMNKKNQYVIHPLGAFVYWGLSDGEIGTPIQFASTENDPKNQWTFAKVPDEVSSEDVNRLSDLDIGSDSWMISSSDVEFGPKIGEGGFGTVFKGTWRKLPVALKVLTNNDGISPTSSTIRREIKIWSSLRHPHVLQFLGANISDDSSFIVTPLMINGNVRDYLDCNPDCNRLKILHQISLGLLYLHTQNIVHGDLKLLNVLIDHGGNGVLCDFGLSRIKADVASRTIRQTPIAITGSRNWMSPERLKGGSPKKPSDIYAFGMVIYEIHTNEIPLGHIDYSEFIELVVNQDIRPERPERDEAPQMTDDSWQLAEDCWRKDPMSRPTIDTVCNGISRFVDIFPVQHQAKSQLEPALTAEPPTFPLPISPQHTPTAKPHPPLSLPIVSHPAPHTFRKIGEFEGHKDTVHSVSFSPDGERIVTGSYDKSVIVWDVRTQKVMLGPLPGHTGGIWSVVYSPDGKQMVSGSVDRSAMVWDARDGKIIKKFMKHTGTVYSVAYSPDSSMIASGSTDRTIQIWDSATGEVIHSLACGEYVQSVAFSPNAQYLVSGAETGFRVWEVGSWRRVQKYHDGFHVAAVAVSPEGNHVAYCSRNKVCVAEMTSWKVIMELQGHTKNVRSLTYSPDGTWIASGSDDGTIRIWETSTGNSILTLKIGSWINSIAISLDGTQIVAGCSNKKIYLYSCNSVV